jgi:hypothetical protein
MSVIFLETFRKGAVPTPDCLSPLVMAGSPLVLVASSPGGPGPGGSVLRGSAAHPMATCSCVIPRRSRISASRQPRASSSTAATASCAMARYLPYSRSVHGVAVWYHLAHCPDLSPRSESGRDSAENSGREEASNGQALALGACVTGDGYRPFCAADGNV